MNPKVLALALVGVLAIGACSDDGGSQAAPVEIAKTDASALEAAQDCSALTEASAPILAKAYQAFIDQVAAMPADEFAAAAADSGTDSLIGGLTASLEADGKVMEARSKDLGCNEADATTAICAAITDVDAHDSERAQAVLRGMGKDC